MSQLIELKIDVKKLNKKKFYEGKKGTYATLTVSVNDEADGYGNDVSVYEAQTEEERKAKADKNYLGNGKTFWANGTAKTASEKGGKGEQKETKAPAKVEDDEDDLPF